MEKKGVTWDKFASVSQIRLKPTQNGEFVTSPIQCKLEDIKQIDPKDQLEFHQQIEDVWSDKTLAEIRASGEYKMIPAGLNKSTLNKKELCELLSALLAIQKKLLLHDYPGVGLQAATTAAAANQKKKKNKKPKQQRAGTKRKREEEEEEEEEAKEEEEEEEEEEEKQETIQAVEKLKKKRKIQSRRETPKTKLKINNPNEKIRVVNLSTYVEFQFTKKTLIQTLRKSKPVYEYLGKGKLNQNQYFIYFPKHRVYVRPNAIDVLLKDTTTPAVETEGTFFRLQKIDELTLSTDDRYGNFVVYELIE